MQENRGGKVSQLDDADAHALLLLILWKFTIYRWDISWRAATTGEQAYIFGVSHYFSIPSVWPHALAPLSQNQLWGLFARHTTMSLIILYLVYSQVSTVVRLWIVLML